MRLFPLSLASSIPVLGLEKVCPRKGCPWPWPQIFFVSLDLVLASSLGLCPRLHLCLFNYFELAPACDKLLTIARQLIEKCYLVPIQTKRNYAVYKVFFSFFWTVFIKLAQRCNYLVGFKIFKNIFEGKKAIYNYALLPSERYADFVSETTTSGNLTKNKQAKVEIIAGYLV